MGRGVSCDDCEASDSAQAIQASEVVTCLTTRIDLIPIDPDSSSHKGPFR